jgi:hypothetical protein
VHCSEILSGKLHDGRERIVRVSKDEISADNWGSMVKKAVITVAIALLVVSLVSACKSKETQQQGGAEATETIAPAAAKPLPTGNEAMTQTVDVEGGSASEGGGVTSPEPPVTTATDGTGAAPTATAPATGAAAVAKGKNAPPVSRNRTQ